MECEERLLKVEYDDYLYFKHLDGLWYRKDLMLNLSVSESLELLSIIRQCLRGDIAGTSVHIGCYDISIMLEYTNTLSISAMECHGEKAKSLGQFTYRWYMGRSNLLTGITRAITELKSV